ncbi:MAG: glycosyltransferase family A protein [Candidatus Korobacteraceae bacterium]
MSPENGPVVRSPTFSVISATRFSLVLATVGRTSELDRFLRSLANQSYRNFELIVVDQNRDRRLDTLVAAYREQFAIHHCKSALGLSRARNVGLASASGDVLAFPDDDCWYSEDLLEQVAGLFAAHADWDGITGRPTDRTFSRYHTVSGPVDKENVFLRSTSYTIFLRRRVADQVGGFDESLGLGTTSGRIAAEETDYLIRALATGHKIFYSADLSVFHPEPTRLYDDKFNQKAYGYNLALGYVLRKHRYPVWYVARTWLRAAGGAGLAMLTLKWLKVRYHYHVLRGRVGGWLGSPPLDTHSQ